MLYGTAYSKEYILAAGFAQKCTMQLAYANICVAEPVSCGYA
jgi:S-adenosylmethionine synthetase